MSFDWNLSSDDEEDDLEEFFSNHEKKKKISTSRNDAPTTIHNDPDAAFPVTPSPPVAAAAAAARSPLATVARLQAEKHPGEEESSDDDDDDEEDDGVDWEDADDDDDDAEEDDDRKPAAIDYSATTSTTTTTTTNKLRAVQIDLDQAPPEDHAKKTKKNKRKRKKLRVDAGTQSLLWNLHRAHLLALTSRALWVSQTAGDPVVRAVAHSLIPPRPWILGNAAADELVDHNAAAADTTRCPTLPELRAFLDWYLVWIHGVEERRQRRQCANRAAGAPVAAAPPRRRKRGADARPPRSEDCGASTELSTDALLRVASYLSATHDEDPQLLLAGEEVPTAAMVVTDPQKVALLMAMARSLGWRARYVQAMEPVSPDLDVEHPLLAATTTATTAMGNIFGWVRNAKKRKVKAAPKAIAVSARPSVPTVESNESSERPIMGWVEILVTVDAAAGGGGKKANAKGGKQHRWIHVDPVHKLVDTPDQVEVLLAQHQQQPSDNKAVSSTKKARTSKSSTSPNKRGVLAYAVGVEHCLLHHPRTEEEVTRVRLTDVTPRYAKSWIASLRQRGILRGKNCSIEETVRQSWWSQTLRILNDHYAPDSSFKKKAPPPSPAASGTTVQDAIVLDSDSEETKPSSEETKEEEEHVEDPFDKIAEMEKQQLHESARNENIPTSKAAFQTHPIYVIPSVLGKAEVLAPDANKRMCGVFKGQLVYRRDDVSTALTAQKWLYQGRKVREAEMKKPIKRVKARKKAAPKGFQALRSYGLGDGSEEQRAKDLARGSEPLDDDGMDKLYGVWQTDAWSPAPVGPNDAIPVNDFKNVELALLNPGLVHIDQTGLATVAKKLGIPYAPCLLGFEGHGGNRTPTIRGIVVHAHNEQIIREAGAEVSSHAIEQEHENRRQAILLRWKRLMVGLLTKERLDREYGSEE